MRRLVLAHWQYDLALRELRAQGVEPTKPALEAWAEAYFGFPVAIDVVPRFLIES